MPLMSRSWSANSERTRARAFLSTLVALTALAVGIFSPSVASSSRSPRLALRRALGVPW